MHDRWRKRFVIMILIGGGLFSVGILSALLSDSTNPNIGGGLAALAGTVLAIAGLLGLGFASKDWKRYLYFLLSIAIVVCLFLVSDVLERGANKEYCRNKIENNETIPEGPEFCKDYF